MSPTMKLFYQHMKLWINSEFPDRAYVNISSGLCEHLHWFMLSQHIHSSNERIELLREMKQQFKDAGLHSDLPFNDSLYDYQSEPNKYANAKRVAWVNKHSA